MLIESTTTSQPHLYNVTRCDVKCGGAFQWGSIVKQWSLGPLLHESIIATYDLKWWNQCWSQTKRWINFRKRYTHNLRCCPNKDLRTRTLLLWCIQTTPSGYDRDYEMVGNRTEEYTWWLLRPTYQSPARNLATAKSKITSHNVKPVKRGIQLKKDQITQSWTRV